MEDQTFWEIVAANVVSIRLHPRNDGNGEVADQVVLVIRKGMQSIVISRQG